MGRDDLLRTFNGKVFKLKHRCKTKRSALSWKKWEKDKPTPNLVRIVPSKDKRYKYVVYVR